MRKPALSPLSILGVLFCIAVGVAQVICNILFLSAAPFEPAVLTIELPIPLIAALLFCQGKTDGATIIITFFTLAMGFFWATGCVALLAHPAFFMGLLLINLGALGTYAAYTLFHYLRRFFAPERS